MAIPAWFDSSKYFDNKLAAMGAGWDTLSLKAAFEKAGYSVTPAGMYQHFSDFGAHEGVSPHPLFNNAQYLNYKGISYFGTANVSPQQLTTLMGQFKAADMSCWEHYQKYWDEMTNNKFINNPSQQFDTNKYMADKLVEWNGSTGTHTMADLIAAFKDAGLTPLEHYLQHGKAEGLTISSVDVGESFQLTTGTDEIYGTPGNDYIVSKIGTLQDADYIDGGAGTNDTLYTHLAANTQKIALQPDVWNVENVVFRVQESYNGSGDNLVQSMVDAGDIHGMTRLKSDNSRATLTVEDVRTNSNAMTIAWADSDPGRDVDFKVYFNTEHLKSDDANITGTMQLQIMDVKGADTLAPNANPDGYQPLKNQPFDQFRFEYIKSDGSHETVTLQFRADDVASYKGDTANYSTLLTAFQHALDDLVAGKPQYAGVFTISSGRPFTSTASVDSLQYEGVGTSIQLSSTQGSISADSDTYPNTGWATTTGTVPAKGRITWDAIAESNADCPLIRTNIELDNVGRVQWTDARGDCLPDESIWGSESGDMVVGGMGARSGIERFDIVVDRGSWLSSLSSTNNTLRMVTVGHADINGDGAIGKNVLGQDNDADYGQLYIGKSLEADSNSVQSWTDAPRLLSTDGLMDVKEFNASDFHGKLNIGASITETSFVKYLRDVDGQFSTANKYAPRGDFHYQLGTNDDTLNMTVNGGIAADRDFRLTMDTNGGNDYVNFSFDHVTNNQLENMRLLGRGHAVKINTGADNDLVKSWGNGVVDVNAGSGNDVVYVGQLADGSVLANAGQSNAVVEHNAVFVMTPLFAAGNLGKMIYFDDVLGAQPLDNDILGGGNNSYALTKTAPSNAIRGTVSFLGFSVSFDIVSAAATGTTNITYDELFRLVSAAVENDQTMSSLLSVKDGAGNSMIFEALIDGHYVTAAGLNPQITFTNVASGITDITAANNAVFNASNPIAQAYDSFISNLGSATTQTQYTIDNPFAAYAGASYAIKIDGTVYYTQAALGAATVAGLATALQGARDINGNYLTEDYTIANTATGITVTDKAVGMHSHDIKLYDIASGGANGTAEGSDTGTVSKNWVDPGTGAITDVNTIVLNVASNAATGYVDILDLNGIFGHMDVVNFDGQAFNGANLADKIDVTHLLGTINGANPFNNNLNTANAAFVNNAGFAHAATNTTNYYTVAEFVTAYAGTFNGTTAGIKNVVFVADQADNTRYTVFQVSTDASATLNASEVTLLGTIDFDNRHANAGGALYNTDLVVS